jgi:RNA polymerase sigma-70 factor (ECF subfamily)
MMTESVDRSGDDTALVRAFQRGERTAFDEIVIKHKDRLFNLCYGFLGDYQEANDTAQDVFIKVYRSLKGFRLESTFSTWLYRIAVNTCRNRLNSRDYRGRRSTVSLDNPGAPEGTHAAMEIEDESPSPMTALESKERWMLIRKAMSSLPPDQKTVVMLRDVEGLSYDEIVEVTGFNLGTVKSRLARARFELRTRLKGVIGNGMR